VIRKLAFVTLVVLGTAWPASGAEAPAPLLLQHPTLSRDAIAFDFAGEIWTVADYIVDYLKRTPQMAVASREGEDVVEPSEGIYGPKAMIVNQMSGSGGDALPWIFRKAGLGPIVGVRTWGGLVGIGGYPPLLDGGSVTAPRWGLYGTKGEWEVENIGITPDIEVEQDPALVRQGRDPQLEKAVEAVLESLKADPPVELKRPPYPDYKQKMPATP
jgi:tricorn protease